MRELNIDWTGLHGAFQMPVPDVRCYLSLADGSIVKLPPGDPGFAAVQSNKADYVAIDAIPSRIQYQWVDEFVATIADPDLKTRVEAAINGKGAFRRFKDILLTSPEERRRWFEFRDEKMRQRIVEWVREKSIEPKNEPPWSAGAVSSATKQQNDPHEVEALRDQLIAWFDGKDAKALAPLALEALATEIGRRFFVKQLK
ncbi:MAG: hypothetical protein HY903_12885 [Deltaproteobacteria bacterium]|nr:hypothetical protein [Deltaproteobacteria bacterium]